MQTDGVNSCPQPMQKGASSAFGASQTEHGIIAWLVYNFSLNELQTSIVSGWALTSGNCRFCKFRATIQSK